MREIKFRAWDNNSNTMVYFGLGEDHIGHIGKDGEYYIMEHRETHPPVMQFTGLKDKNGKEIYEGDVCLIGDKGFAKPMQIIYEDGCFGIKWERNHFAELKYYIVYPSCEVIGNIYENGDLLTQEAGDDCLV